MTKSYCITYKIHSMLWSLNTLLSEILNSDLWHCGILHIYVMSNEYQTVKLTTTNLFCIVVLVSQLSYHAAVSFFSSHNTEICAYLGYSVCSFHFVCIPLDSHLASLLCCSIIDYLLNVAHRFRIIVLGHISGNMSCREVRNLALLYEKDFNFEVVSSCSLFRNHSDQYTLYG